MYTDRYERGCAMNELLNEIDSGYDLGGFVLSQKQIKKLGLDVQLHLVMLMPTDPKKKALIFVNHTFKIVKRISIAKALSI